MPVKVELAYDGYILRYSIEDPWDIPDLITAYDTERELRDRTPHVLHSVTDFSAARNIPKNWLSAKSGPGLSHPRSGEMLLVGLNPGLKILVDIILKLARFKRIQVFKTMEEAEPYLQELVVQARAESRASVE